MKGVYFVGDSEVEIREIPKPAPGPGDVVLQMKASGVCGSDLRPYRMSKSEKGDPSKLHVGGHEPCGVVAELGEGVTDVAVGDRVMMHHYTGCGECRLCRMGMVEILNETGLRDAHDRELDPSLSRRRPAPRNSASDGRNTVDNYFCAP